MKLSVIILNWHAATDTINCVRQIENWQAIEALVWVVDNASEDDSLKRIKKACPGVKLIQNRANLGFSGGTNVGIEASLAVDERPILLLNNDASIDEAAVIALWQSLAQNKNVGFAGPLLYSAENPAELISAGSKNPVLHLQTREKTPNTTEALAEVFNVSGTAVLIRASLLKQLGLLDEDYFFSTELADLCTRGRQAGYISIINPSAKAYHTLSRSASYRSVLYVYYIIRNRFLYINKFYSQPLKATLIIIWAFYSFALTLKLRLSGQTATAKAVWLGLYDGLTNRFGGQNKRVLAHCNQPTFNLAELSSNS